MTPTRHYCSTSAYHGQALFKGFAYIVIESSHLCFTDEDVESDDHTVVNGGYSDPGGQAPEWSLNPSVTMTLVFMGVAPGRLNSKPPRLLSVPEWRAGRVVNHSGKTRADDGESIHIRAESRSQL